MRVKTILSLLVLVGLSAPLVARSDDRRRDPPRPGTPDVVLHPTVPTHPPAPHQPPRPDPYPPHRPPVVIYQPPVVYRPPVVYEPTTTVYYRSSGSCSRDIKQKNIDALEPALAELAASEAFKDAEFFRETLARIRGLNDVEKKVAEYSKIVEVDTDNPIQFGEFLGARDLTVYVERAERNLALTEDQAKLAFEVVETIQTKLKGGVNRSKKQ